MAIDITVDCYPPGVHNRYEHVRKYTLWGSDATLLSIDTKEGTTIKMHFVPCVITETKTKE